jgi:TldD protein
MKKTTSHFLFFIVLGLQLICCCNYAKAQDRLLTILQEEAKREFNVLKTQEVPAYYIGYRVDDIKNYNISAQFGALTNSSGNNSRLLTITIRVGTHQLDNSHSVRDVYDNPGAYNNYYKIIELPIEENAEAIKNITWKATNDAYQEAVSKFSKVKANVSVKIEEEDRSPDFSQNTPSLYEEKPLNFENLMFDKKEWEARLKKYSLEFLKDTSIFYGVSSIDYQITRKYYVSSDGDNVVQNNSSCNVILQGSVKAIDGMEMPLYKTFFSYQPDHLPSDAEMQRSTETIVANLISLKNAPIANPFSGPALLSSEASGVFFHEIFGHRVEGQRMKSENDAQTFKKMIGQLVLPKSFSVYSNPLMKSYEGVDLKGYYLYDDQASKAENVSIVENGILRNFLMSRTPINGFPKTNGHARSESGRQVESRQSNLIIETTDTKTNMELRAELIRLAKEQKAEYGYLFQQVTGGFTVTGRYDPSAFNVTPTLVYRVYVDGRPDEIVRGVNLIGTPLSIFSQIDMAGGSKGVFNGMCGAESGWVPVSCCSPMVLVKLIETQKKAKSQERSYILPRPEAKR